MIIIIRHRSGFTPYDPDTQEIFRNSGDQGAIDSGTIRDMRPARHGSSVTFPFPWDSRGFCDALQEIIEHGSNGCVRAFIDARAFDKQGAS